VYNILITLKEARRLQPLSPQSQPHLKTSQMNMDNYSDDEWDIDEYTPSPEELKDLMNPTAYKPESVVCVECGKEIPPSTRSFSIEAGRIHEKCYKPSNLIPLIPIGWESIEAWRNSRI
jgi:hypothetical protein